MKKIIIITVIFVLTMSLVSLLIKNNTFSVNGADNADYFEGLGIHRFEDKFKAPDFSLKNLEGEAVNLENLKGKIVFLNFWATWCPACRDEMPSMEKLYTKFKDKDFIMLAVNLREKPKTVRSFKEEYRLNFPILLDTDGSVSYRYGVRSIPATFLIDREGHLIGRAVGARDWASDLAFNLINQLTSQPALAN
jgi:peroxiredoxin